MVQHKSQICRLIIELLRHHDGTKFLKILNSKISKKNSHSRGMKFQPGANNNREAVVVCVRYVVKRPSKRMRASTSLNPICVHFQLHSVKRIYLTGIISPMYP